MPARSQVLLRGLIMFFGCVNKQLFLPESRLAQVKFQSLVAKPHISSGQNTMSGGETAMFGNHLFGRQTHHCWKLNHIFVLVQMVLWPAVRSHSMSRVLPSL